MTKKLELKVSFKCWRCKKVKLNKDKSLSGRGMCKLCNNEYQKPYIDDFRDKRRDNPTYIVTEEEREKEARNNLKELTE